MISEINPDGTWMGDGRTETTITTTTKHLDGCISVTKTYSVLQCYKLVFNSPDLKLQVPIVLDR